MRIHVYEIRWHKRAGQEERKPQPLVPSEAVLDIDLSEGEPEEQVHNWLEESFPCWRYDSFKLKSMI